MSPLAVFWHFCNFFAPAWCVAALLALMSKLLWRAELRSLSWLRLALAGGLGGSLGLMLALLLLGHDGKMLGYALMLALITLPQTWVSLRR